MRKFSLAAKRNQVHSFPKIVTYIVQNTEILGKISVSYAVLNTIFFVVTFCNDKCFHEIRGKSIWKEKLENIEVNRAKF